MPAPRTVGQAGTVTHRYAVPDHVDDQDGRDRGGAPAPRVRAPRRRRPRRRASARSSPTSRSSTGFDGDTPRLRAPRTQATVRHLLTHTSGLGYWFFDADLARYEQVTGTPNVLGGAGAFKAPLLHDPGARFTYGINTDWLGKVIEAVTGQGLDVVVKEKITGPLGMADTMFLLDPARTENAVTVHVPGEGGSWASAGELLPQDPDWWAGGHGLYSTPRDYIRFEQALLRGGELDGERILAGRASRTPSPTRSAP